MQDGTRKEIQGIKKPLQSCPIIESQMGKCMRKGCQLYAIQVGFTNSKENTPLIKNIPIVQEFMDVFPEEIPGLSPRRDIDFTIELISGASPISRTPYQMSIPELTELKMQFQELFDKGYIRPSVSPWGALVLFVKKKVETM